MKRTEQKRLSGGTVEDYEKSRKMFEALTELIFEPRPIIGHTAWKDSISTQQRWRIQFERMNQIKEANGEKIREATNYEALIYISTVSLAMPLSSMWQRIYSYLFKKFYPDKSDFIPAYEARLDIQSEPELRRLKSWLWKQSKTTRA